jgi:hypothetical protein
MTLGNPAYRGITRHLREFMAIIAVRWPRRAHARAASHPAWPAPTTTTSYALCIWSCYWCSVCCGCGGFSFTVIVFSGSLIS